MSKKLPAWLVLTLIALVAALALGATYNGTKDRIATQEAEKAVAVRQELLPAAQDFALCDAEEGAAEVWRGLNADGSAAGYVSTGTVTGFGGPVEVTVGTDAEGVITGVRVGGANFQETAGLGAKSKEPAFYEQFTGKVYPVDLSKNGGEIDAITAATITSSAVVRGVNDTLKAMSAAAGFKINEPVTLVDELGNNHYATSKKGFGGDVYVELTVEDGTISGIIIGDDRFNETAGYGARAKEESFWGQYIGKSGTNLVLGQDIDAVVLTLRGAQQFGHLLFHFVGRHETAVVLVHAIEPHRLGLPVFGSGEYQFGLHIIVGQRMGGLLHRHNLFLGERIDHPAVHVLAGRLQSAVIDRVLKFLGGQHAQDVHLLAHRLVTPEGHNVVEVASHRGDILGIGVTVVQKCVGEALLVGHILHGVAGFEAAHGHHLLAGAPVYHTGRCGIVEHGVVNLLHQAALAVHLHLPNLHVGGERVVVHLHAVEVAPAGGGEHLVEDVAIDVAQAALLHHHTGAVEEGDNVIAGIVRIRHRRELLLHGLGAQARRHGKEAKE